MSSFKVSRVRDILHNEPVQLRRLRPHIVVLVIGGNDISRHTSSEEVAFKIIALCTLLHNRYHVRQVVLCQVMPRFNKSLWRYRDDRERLEDEQDKEAYRRTALGVNKILEIECKNYSYLQFWNHNGKFAFPEMGPNHRRYFSSDGVHMSDKGQYRLYKSLRGAVIAAVNREVHSQ